jgi:hypothetical protein
VVTSDLEIHALTPSNKAEIIQVELGRDPVAHFRFYRCDCFHVCSPCAIRGNTVVIACDLLNLKVTELQDRCALTVPSPLEMPEIKPTPSDHRLTEPMFAPSAPGLLPLWVEFKLIQNGKCLAGLITH